MAKNMRQEVRCPRCGRYKGCGQFFLLELKCEKCKLLFEVTYEEGKLIFKTVMEGRANRRLIPQASGRTWLSATRETQ